MGGAGHRGRGGDRSRGHGGRGRDTPVEPGRAGRGGDQDRAPHEGPPGQVEFLGGDLAAPDLVRFLDQHGEPPFILFALQSKVQELSLGQRYA